MKKRLKDFFLKVAKKLDKLIYRNKDFIVVSNNCWGAEIYKSLNMEYNTPFVGLFIYGPDYIRLLENFEYYMDCKLEFSQTSKWKDTTLSYPVGLLDEIEIHFLHYRDSEEAIIKWKRRLERMKNSTKEYGMYFFKICDRDGVDQEIINRFHALPFQNKISFGLKPENHAGHFCITESEKGMTVPDGLKLYHASFKYLDVLNWVNTGRMGNTIYNRTKTVFLSGQ